MALVLTIILERLIRDETREFDAHEATRIDASGRSCRTPGVPKRADTSALAMALRNRSVRRN